MLIDNNKSSLSCLHLNVSKAYFSLEIFLLQIEYLKLVQSLLIYPFESTQFLDLISSFFYLIHDNKTIRLTRVFEHPVKPCSFSIHLLNCKLNEIKAYHKRESLSIQKR